MTKLDNGLYVCSRGICYGRAPFTCAHESPDGTAPAPPATKAYVWPSVRARLGDVPAMPVTNRHELHVGAGNRRMAAKMAAAQHAVATMRPSMNPQLVRVPWLDNMMVPASALPAIHAAGEEED